MEVKNPLHGSQPVAGHALGLLIAVHVHPDHIVPELEGPSQAAVLGAPLPGRSRDQLTLGVYFQQRCVGIAQHIQVKLVLTVENKEGFHFRSLQRKGHKVRDRLAAVVRLDGLAGLPGGFVSGGRVAAGLGGGVLAAAG